MSQHYEQVARDTLEAFTVNTFSALLNGLSTDGYVLDLVEVTGAMFTAQQIAYLDQKTFKELCNKFTNISVDFTIGSTGAYFEGHGNMYIAYNEDLFSHEDAVKLLNSHVSKLVLRDDNLI